MGEILEKLPELENRIYVISGPRQQALEEAITILLRTTDRCFISPEFFCLKDSQETIERLFDETAAATGLGKGAHAFFTNIKNGNLEAVNRRILGSYDRRFVRLVFIDSLEYLHLKGQKHNREDVLNNLTTVTPVIVVSDNDTDGVKWDINGVAINLSIK